MPAEPTERVRTAKRMLDLAVTVTTGIAALLVIARLASGPSGPGGRQTHVPKIEDLASLNLSTSSTGVVADGLPDAQIAILEFSDFECPFCAKHAEDTFPLLEREFIETGYVRYFVRQYPLEQIHPSALPAARGAYCADLQAHYWEMRRMLFSRRAVLAQTDWHGVSDEMGLNTQEFDRCVVDQDVVSRIEEDRREGTRLGVVATPTFFIGHSDGHGGIKILRRIRGAAPLEVFRKGLEGLLGAVSRT